MWSRRLINVFLIQPLAWALLDIEFSGLDRVPADDPFILMVNHCNVIDPGVAIIAMLPRELVLFTKAENLHIPFVGALFRWYGVVPVERGEPDRIALRRAVDVLTKQREILLVAPEGTRSYDGRLLPAKKGMAFIATRANVPVLPVGVTGVRDFWQNVQRLRRTHVRATIGYPFRFRAQGRVRGETLEEMTREAMYQLAALLPAEQWGAYADIENATERHLEFLHPGCSNLIYASPGTGSAIRACRRRLVGVSG